jgi:hypothetical protein
MSSPLGSHEKLRTSGLSVEAAPVLRKKIMQITESILDFQNIRYGSDMYDFLGQNTLHNIRHVSLVMDFEDETNQTCWYRTVEKLWNIHRWKQINRSRCT